MDLIQTIKDFFITVSDWLEMTLDAIVSFVTSSLQAIPYMTYAISRVPAYFGIFPRYISIFMSTGIGLVILWQFLDKD